MVQVNDSLANVLEPDDKEDDVTILLNEDGTPKEAKSTTEEETAAATAAAAKTAEEEKVAADEKAAADALAAKTTDQSVEEQNKELRQILRAQKRDISVLQSKLSRVEKRTAVVPKKAGEAGETDMFGDPVEPAADDGKVVAEELSDIEIAQNNLAVIAQVKEPFLETLLETMTMNPKYSDITEVCSQSNFNDIFDAVGKAVADKEGKDSSLAALEAEIAVWKMANPYKYMYDLIKKYHPSYSGKVEKVETEEEKITKVAAAAAAKVKKVEAPDSLANVDGKGAPAQGAWTAARIDDMEEMDLHTVPPEIYQKYLIGGLD